ncbi:MAG TPA: hypothetical protein VFB81_05865 [Myxococcales bacterium]|nr:hypothetical protein [Myxococcales bacterium]
MPEKVSEVVIPIDVHNHEFTPRSSSAGRSAAPIYVTFHNKRNERVTIQLEPQGSWKQLGRTIPSITLEPHESQSVDIANTVIGPCTFVAPKLDNPELDTIRGEIIINPNP